MRPQKNPRGTAIFIAIAVMLMLCVTMFTTFLASDKKSDLSLMKGSEKPAFMTDIEYRNKDFTYIVDETDLGDDEFEEIFMEYVYPDFDEQTDEQTDEKINEQTDEAIPALDSTIAPEPENGAGESDPTTNDPTPEPENQTQITPQYDPTPVSGKPKIAIIIDDMGVDRRRSFEVMNLNAPLTLAFLPYAERLNDITQKAKAQGHELMIHMPMQATTNPVSLGPIALKTGMNERQVKTHLNAAYNSFSGYTGVNNHMGSQVTQDPQIMNWVMQSLKNKGLYFIDSKTIGSSIAVDVAKQNGLPTIARDIFLDHESTPEFVTSALAKTERIAKKQGYAIAIGHPKDATINGLKAWLPQAQAKGFEIVHAGTLVQRPKNAPAQVIAQKVASKNTVIKITNVQNEAYKPQPQAKAKTQQASYTPTTPKPVTITNTETVQFKSKPIIINRQNEPNPETRQKILKRLLKQNEYKLNE